MSRLILLLFLATTLSCGHTIAEEDGTGLTDSGDLNLSSQEFNEYWYSGQAEITSYTLQQARYGEIHPGESVLVFVTEDFLLDAQVKKESATNAPFSPILKLNRIDRFTTGIYDYSTMLSAFSAVQSDQYEGPIKTTYSSQDWCGQSWMQLNKREEGYVAEVRSYFEAEGDKELRLGDVLLEDGLWGQARLNPRQLPQGKLEILPSSQHIRFHHGGAEIEEATARLAMEVDEKDGERFIYSLIYENGRELTMYIQTVFPFRILGWEEKAMSGWGGSRQMLTTKATMKSSLKSPYWSKNSASDVDQRKLLKLD